MLFHPKNKSMKTHSSFVLLILALILTLELRAQSGSGTGTIQLTPNGILDVVHDGQGNRYALADLNIASAKFSGTVSAIISATCQAGYFTLHFDQGSNFFHNNNSAQTVACQVFNNISTFLSSSLAPGSIHIHCDDEMSGSLATCGQFYVFPWNPVNYNQGIIDGQVQKALLSGVDPYANIPMSLANASAYYHGKLSVTPNAVWNYNLNTVAINAGEYDFYSVLLHEVCHALGFQSLMKFDGKSKFVTAINPANNYFSRYDRHLYDHTGNPLLAASNTPCPNSDLTFAPASTSVLSVAQQSSSIFQNTTFCNIAVQYSSTAAGTIAVHTPSFFSGSSLDHFEDICSGTYAGTCTSSPGANDLYFVMSNFTSTGPCYIKRHLTEEERLVLCDLGYTVASSYGGTVVAGSYKAYNSGTCSQTTIFGQHDGMSGNTYTISTLSNSINILYSSLLQNDIPASGLTVSCMDMVTQGNLSKGLSDFTVTATAGSGLQVVKYYPEDATGKLGNATYVFIYFVDAACVPVASCSYIKNGGFENTKGTLGCGVIGNQGLTLDCWENYVAPSGVFPGEIVSQSCISPNYQINNLYSKSISTLNVGTGPNDKCLGLVCNNFGTSVVKNVLNSPLIQNHTYQVSMWIINHGSIPNTASPNHADNPVVITLASNPSFAFLAMINYPAGLDFLTSFTVNAGYSWTQVTHTFVYTATASANAFLIGIDPVLTPTLGVSGEYYYCLVDEISIVPFPQPSLSIPHNSICATKGISDLSQYASTTGTFSGAAVIYNGNEASFNSPPILEPGVYPIAFTYSTTCLNTIYHSITVEDCCSSASIPVYLGTSVTGTVSIYNTSRIPHSFTLQPGAYLVLDGEFMIAKDVSITVSSGAVLKIEGSHLYSCTGMWGGIKIKDGGKVVMASSNGRDNLIEDAIIAIDCSDQFTTSVGTVLDITNTTFNRNYKGIKLTGYDGSSNNYTNPLSLRNCVFTSRHLPFTPTSWPQTGTASTSSSTTADLRYATTATTSLSEPYLGQAGFDLANLKGQFHPAYIAIELKDVGVSAASGFTGITVGDISGAFNLFDGHGFFIKAENSNVTSQNNVFQNTQRFGMDIYYPGNPSPMWGIVGGSAIESKVSNLMNCALEISGTSTDNGNRFWNCHYGISGTNVYKFNSEYNIFRSTQSTASLPGLNFLPQGHGAIGIASNRFQYLVRYNEFTNISQCINFPLASGAYSTVASGTATGIYASLIGIVQNTFSPGTGTGNYISNAVNISCVNAFTPVVITNTNVSPPASGIIIENNNFNDVYRAINVNGITGLHNEIRSNTIRLVTDNVISSTQYGIKVTNGISATSSGFYTSVHQNHITGVGTATSNPNEALVFLEKNAGLATPSVCCNEMGDGHTGFKVVGDNPNTIWAGNVMTPLIRGLELFDNGVLGQQGHSQIASANEWRGTWTANTNYGTWVGSNSSATASILYVNNTMAPPNNDGSVFLPDKYVFNQTFFHSSGGDYNCGGNPNSIVISLPDFESYQSATYFSMAENLFYRSLRLDPETKHGQNRNVVEYHDGLEGTKVDTLMDIEQLLFEGDYLSARTLNNDFEAEEDNLCEETYKEFYRIYANVQESTVNGEPLSASDSSALYALAFLCPGTHGPAIYQARALFAYIFPAGFEFGDCAGDQGARKSSYYTDEKKSLTAKNWSIAIFPNPATNQVNFNSAVENELLHVSILDISGRLVITKKVQMKEHKGFLNLDLKEGLYFVAIQGSSDGSVVRKLVIAK